MGQWAKAALAEALSAQASGNTVTPEPIDDPLAALLQVQAYFQRHHRHTRYQQFERLGLSLDSGIVESTCKWLIQQRFKGVGMRWSEEDFNHLLLLRLAWANDRFDTSFTRS